MNYKNIWAAGLICLSFLSCDKYLDEAPSKSKGIEITTIEQLDALLNKAAFTDLKTQMAPGILYRGDSFGMTAEQYLKGFKSTGVKIDLIQQSVGEVQYLENTNHLVSFWAASYQGVFMANLVLGNIEKVSGSDEFKARVKARAHLLRAYSYFDLAQYYCLPYGPATLAELGLPIKKTTGYEEDVHRVSLKDTYDFIEADVQEAVKLKDPIRQSEMRVSWKETGATANALAARFYMAKGQYDQAEKYASASLSYANDIRDYSDGTITQVMDAQSNQLVASNTLEQNRHPSFAADWDKAFYNRTHNFLFDYCFPIVSNKLMALYGDHEYDLRRKFFILKDMKNIGSLKMFVGSRFDPDVKIPGYYVHGNLEISLAPNVAEMMLTEIEAKARQGHYQQAMVDLNRFRKYRMDRSTPTNILQLTAQDQNQAVQQILDERQREFPYTVRWLDLRRINFNDDPKDDVVITKQFYKVNASAVDYNSAPITYELKPGSRKYAIAIPMQEIVASNGVIVQNKY